MYDQLAWPGKRQNKQQSTEKTGVDVWPNVSSTRAELRSKVKDDRNYRSTADLKKT